MDEILTIYQRLSARERLQVLQEILKISNSTELSIINQKSFLLLRIDFLSELPFELSLRILSFCDAKSLCQASKVSRVWMKMANDDWVWHRMCNQHINHKCKGCGMSVLLI